MSQDINTPMCMHCSDPIDLDGKDETDSTFCGANPKHDSHERYPADAEFAFVPVFADVVKFADVLAIDREGNMQVEVIEPPRHHKNLISPHRWVILKTRLVGVRPDEEALLVYAQSTVIYQRRFVRSATYPELDTEL